jgi:hypothetical protein
MADMMARLRAWLRPPRNLLVLFLLVILLPAATLVVLGVRLLEQDRVSVTRTESAARSNGELAMNAASRERGGLMARVPADTLGNGSDRFRPQCPWGRLARPGLKPGVRRR